MWRVSHVGAAGDGRGAPVLPVENIVLADDDESSVAPIRRHRGAT
jgi:hypothetical protein